MRLSQKLVPQNFEINSRSGPQLGQPPAARPSQRDWPRIHGANHLGSGEIDPKIELLWLG
jgi:hypothetical protein